MLSSGVGYRDEAAAWRMPPGDEASILGGLPHRQSWTRCTPHVEHFGVAARVAAHPLQEVEQQGVNGVSHSGPSVEIAPILPVRDWLSAPSVLPRPVVRVPLLLDVGVERRLVGG